MTTDDTAPARAGGVSPEPAATTAHTPTAGATGDTQPARRGGDLGGEGAIGPLPTGCGVAEALALAGVAPAPAAPLASGPPQPAASRSDGRYVTVREAAQTLGVCEDTIRRWRRAGRLSGIKVGGTVRIARADLEPMRVEPEPVMIGPRPLTPRGGRYSAKARAIAARKGL